MKLTEKETQLLKRYPGQLTQLLVMGVFSSTATLTYIGLAGAQFAKEYHLFQSQPQTAASAGKDLIREYVKKHEPHEGQWILEQLSAEKTQERQGRMDRLSMLEPKTEVERELRDLLISRSSLVETLFNLLLTVLGWHGSLERRFVQIVLFGGLGFFIAGTSIGAYLTARPLLKISLKLSQPEQS